MKKNFCEVMAEVNISKRIHNYEIEVVNFNGNVELKKITCMHDVLCDIMKEIVSKKEVVEVVIVRVDDAVLRKSNDRNYEITINTVIDGELCEGVFGAHTPTAYIARCEVTEYMKESGYSDFEIVSIELK